MNIAWLHVFDCQILTYSKHWCNDPVRLLCEMEINIFYWYTQYVSREGIWKFWYIPVHCIEYNEFLKVLNLGVLLNCTSVSSEKFDILFSVVLIVISVCTAVGAWTWLWDSQTKQVLLLLIIPRIFCWKIICCIQKKNFMIHMFYLCLLFAHLSIKLEIIRSKLVRCCIGWL